MREVTLPPPLELLLETGCVVATDKRYARWRRFRREVNCGAANGAAAKAIESPLILAACQGGGRQKVRCETGGGGRWARGQQWNALPPGAAFSKATGTMRMDAL